MSTHTRSDEDIAAAICPLCQKPIGYDSAYCISEGEAAAHAKCVQDKMNRQMYGHDPDAPDSEQMHAILDAMEQHGGGFVQALATAWRKADPGNSRKLRMAFPEYFKQYAKAAADDAARKGGERR